ncbi:hypothetical protein FACS1894123_02570 [Bacteroidia bacterium]|nr:hypothetical protein FACS1894123_02570 [Bacteroidia bacterium]
MNLDFSKIKIKYDKMRTKMNTVAVVVAFLLTMTFSLQAQTNPAFKSFERFFVQPKHYVAGFTSTPPVIDGNIDEKIWEQAVWTDEFRDIEGELSDRPLPYYNTRVKMLWDKDYLYIAAYLKDKHVWANLKERDQIVYHDNDFEVFIDPHNSGVRYFEYEINALNTIFDLYLGKPYRTGGDILIPWNSDNMKNAIRIMGTLNDPSDEDEGWTVEWAIPFKDMGVSSPKNNNIWRLGFSRVEWDTEISGGKYVKKTDSNGKNLPENNWVWSPTGAIDMHMPERWGYIQFSEVETGKTLPEFVLPYGELQRQYLWLGFYKQREYHKKHQKYASSLGELGLTSKVTIDGSSNILTLEATSKQFTLTISDSKNAGLQINNDGLVN